jgi:hypothetical protein
MATSAATVPAQLLAHIKGRKFPSAGKLFASNVDFHAWTPTGHWIANDPSTVGKILEVWYSPGAGSSNVLYSNETAGAKGTATLEIEIELKVQPDDQTRVLRQFYILTIGKDDKISRAHVYCAGLHTEFPEVDLEKQRRAKGIGGLKPAPISPRAVAAKAS